MSSDTLPRWLPVSLILSGLHSLVWGCFIVLLPAPAAAVYGLAETPHELFLWKGTGLIMALLGIGYVIAASNPLQHWVVVLIGLLAKVLGPIGMLVTVLRGEISNNVLWLLPANDVIWWIPFSIVVIRGWRHSAASDD